MAVNSRRCFYFGTEEHMEMFATPLQGADSSPQAWGAEGTLLNGGGWGMNSWASHKQYTYEWPQSSSPEVAQKMKSYRDGTYGRGLLYFLEPGIYRTNVLPAQWADPSMAIDSEAPSLVYNVKPIAISTSGAPQVGLPVQSAYYPALGNPADMPVMESSVFIPLPPGHTLHVGAYYSATGTGGVFATPVNNNGTWGDAVTITPQDNSSVSLVTESFTDVRGIRLWVGRSSSANSTLTLAGMIAKIVETGKPVDVSGGWIGGQGHSGCRFSGTPSYVTNSPIEGGRVGFAATFKEVGSWIYG